MLDLSRLEASLSSSYDLLVLVNPNNPTGRHVPKARLEQVLRRAPEQTRIWVDEAYVDYAGPGQSLEGFAAVSKNVVVCKSMSKVYALSGLRAGYLCGPPDLVAELKLVTPPWAVSLPAQVAAVKALEDLDYYAECWRATHALRAELIPQVSALGTMEIVPSVANFMLCHLDPEGPDAAQVIAGCRRHQLYLRDASAMGSQLGRHALRIAVKDAETNRRMVDILERVLHEEAR